MVFNIHVPYQYVSCYNISNEDMLRIMLIHHIKLDACLLHKNGFVKLDWKCYEITRVWTHLLYAFVVQLVQQRSLDQKFDGSSPTSSTSVAVYQINYYWHINMMLCKYAGDQNKKSSKWANDHIFISDWWPNKTSHHEIYMRNT